MGGHLLDSYILGTYEQWDADRENRKMRKMDSVCVALIIPVLASLSMWVAFIVYPPLNYNQWFTDEIFGRLFVVGVVSSLAGIIYTSYVSIWCNRYTADVTACGLLSFIGLAVNVIGAIYCFATMPRL